ncbi:hypothetical protein BURPS1710b_0588 [Burkholderia pseudomallei 1710b]|uniref:Uncharacterized protein n=1 Tax=Burkholderia pseudomallei (strain 1710b) TaxID=320372 RepID=Q3JWQ2_BURP1|nr:hypothetical protein BURPS1710b_0588 [Burkholderia pseudomallei 1710b]
MPRRRDRERRHQQGRDHGRRRSGRVPRDHGRQLLRDDRDVRAVHRADDGRAARHARRHRERGRRARAAGLGRVQRVEGGGDQVSRSAEGRAAARASRGRDDRARLHPHADDRAQPVSDAVPDGCGPLREARGARDLAENRVSRDSMADGHRREAAARDAALAVRSPVREGAAQTQGEGGLSGADAGARRDPHARRRRAALPPCATPFIHSSIRPFVPNAGAARAPRAAVSPSRARRRLRVDRRLGRQPRLHVARQRIDEHFVAAGRERVERLPDDVLRAILRHALRVRDHVGIDIRRMQREHARALLAQLVADRVRRGPRGRLRNAVRARIRQAEPRQHRQHVDDRAAAVLAQHRRERTRHRERAEEIRVELRLQAAAVRLREQRAHSENARVVDEQIDVAQLARGGGDILRARDVEPHRLHAGRRHARRIARGRIDFLRARGLQPLDEREPQAAIRAGHQYDGIIQIHLDSLQQDPGFARRPPAAACLVQACAAPRTPRRTAQPTHGSPPNRCGRIDSANGASRTRCYTETPSPAGAKHAYAFCTS